MPKNSKHIYVRLEVPNIPKKEHKLLLSSIADHYDCIYSAVEVIQPLEHECEKEERQPGYYTDEYQIIFPKVGK